MKLCVNCAHHVPVPSRWDSGTTKPPSAYQCAMTMESPVDGTFSQVSCETQRLSGPCGITAKLYLPKADRVRPLAHTEGMGT